MTSAAYPFSLIPHPATADVALTAITGHLRRTRDALWVRYVLAGDIERLRIPAHQPACFADGLWRRTCCELFVARKGEAAYHECNFSPSGEWAAYAFTRTRERAAGANEQALIALDPDISVRRGAETLELQATVRLDRLSARYTGGALLLAVSVVIEHRDGSLSYWALAHPQAQPDFHHPDAFVLELDEVRN